MISAVVLTKNEEEQLGDCLKALAWVDEIIVIDDHSSDKTVSIAKSYKAKVFQRELSGDFASQRNFGLEKAAGEWVLFVDADEIVTDALRLEIQTKTQNPKAEAYSIKRIDYFWGKPLKYGETGNAAFIKLARKAEGKWQRKVHETWETEGGTIDKLKNPLLHYPHKTVSDFLKSVDFYSTLHAQANNEEGKRSSLVKIIFLPKLKFLQNWILKGGFLDGNRGFFIAMMMSLHSYLAWSKLWLLQNKATVNPKP